MPKLTQKEICNIWLKNKTINPETSRKITENGPIYKQLQIKCSLNQKEKNKDINIKNYISSIQHKNNCLKLFKKTNKTLKYKLGNDIILDKKLDKTKNNIVFLGNYNNYKFSVKILEKTKNNKYEFIILKELTKKIIDLECPHFIFNYGYLKCVKINLTSDDEKLYYPPILNKSNNLYFQINKLASGNLNKILKLFYNNYEILLNSFIQSLISIMFFHKYINAYHCNANSNNFLYHKIKPGGYFHYNFYGKDYYLENIGYLWVLSDFNSIIPFIDSKEINNNKFGDLISFIPVLTDFDIIINDFSKLATIRKIIDKIKIVLQFKYNKNVNSFILPNVNKDLLELLVDNKSFTTAKPSKIINKNPYIIR